MQVYLAPKSASCQQCPWQRVAGRLSDPWSSPPGQRILESPGLFRINRSKSLTWKVERRPRERGQNLHKAVKEPELNPGLPTSTRTVFFVDVMRLSSRWVSQSQTLKAGRGTLTAAGWWHQSGHLSPLPSWPCGMMYMVLAHSELDRVEKKPGGTSWCLP